MAKSDELRKKAKKPVTNEEDPRTLAAIGEGIRDAKSGKILPLDEVRKQLRKWTTESSSRKQR